MLKVNLGCGDQVIEGWTNVDYAIGARLASNPVLGPVVRRLGLFQMKWNPEIVIHNLTRRLPWDDVTVDTCYTSHTIEHMSREEGAALVREVYRVLKPGGVLRVVVPDIAAIIDRYRGGNLTADHFVEELGVLYSVEKRGIRKVLAPMVEFPHKCMYDSETMQKLLQSAGFDAAARAAFDSAIADIRRIEKSDRTQDAVVVEGRKPV